MLSSQETNKLMKVQNFRSVNRYHHASVLVNNHIYIFGGSRPSIPRDNQFFDIDLTPRREKETEIAVNNPPPRRGDHSMVYYKGSLYVFGGELLRENIFYSDFYQFNLSLFCFCFPFLSVPSYR